MRKISTREVRTVLPRLDEVLAEEGELIVTRRGKAVARLLPLEQPEPRPSHADLRARMRRLDRGSEDLIRGDRDAR